MNYQEKVAKAEMAADKLLSGMPIDEIRKLLREDNVSDSNVPVVIRSMYNVLGDKVLPDIQEAILRDEDISAIPGLKFFDEEEIAKFKTKAMAGLSKVERTKAAKMLRAGSTRDEIIEAIDTRLLTQGELIQQIETFETLKKHNSGGGRMIRLAGGVGLFMIFGALWVFASRIFYMLPIIALGLMGSAFLTKTELD